MTTKTIGDLTDELRTMYLAKKKLAADLETAKAGYAVKELELIEAADRQNTTAGRGKIGTFTLGETEVPQVSDWDKFYAFIYKRKYGHLVERRPSVTGCRELWETKGPIPGVDKFTKRTINLRGV